LSFACFEIQLILNCEKKKNGLREFEAKAMQALPVTVLTAASKLFNACCSSTTAKGR
jgi:hypothetical protein